MLNTSHKPQATSHKPQATSHKPQAFKLGFTLSELLVSLAVLGLIAGLTVPSIVVNIAKNREKLALREAYQIVSSITAMGVLNGDFTNITNWRIDQNTIDPQGIVAYITSQLNYTKQCFVSDITSPGCRNSGWAVGNLATAIDTSNKNRHNARWILPNGAKIQALHSGGASGWADSPSAMAWVITPKSYTGFMDIYNTRGANSANTFMLKCNIMDTPAILNLGSGATATRVNPGQCKGEWNNLPFLR
jgi:prepilin-type N-terminal cleavage/methylation domain-containing protein